MDLTQLLALFTSDPQITARTGIRFLHFIGLALGLGGALLLDLMMLRFFIRGKIVEEAYRIVDFASKVVHLGLRILWITGVGFLFLYALTKPELLSNPKVHAKLLIVLILTANGYFIHSIILPGVKAQIGNSLFTNVSPARRTIFVISGAISAISWIFPVGLGVFSQLNFTVSAVTILYAYLAIISLTAMAMHAMIYFLNRTNVSNLSVPIFQRDSNHRVAINSDFLTRIQAAENTNSNELNAQTLRQRAKARLILKPKLESRGLQS